MPFNVPPSRARSELVSRESRRESKRERQHHLTGTTQCAQGSHDAGLTKCEWKLGELVSARKSLNLPDAWLILRDARQRAWGSRIWRRAGTIGIAAIGVFLFFGATMASLAALTLLWRGTPLDRIWGLNPTAYNQLAPLADTVAMLFALLGVALAAAVIGWFRRRLWGWRLRSRSSLHRLSGMSLTASEAIGCVAELALSSPEHCCCSFCVQRSGAHLLKIVFEGIRK
jgi:hypothetical protein